KCGRSSTSKLSCCEISPLRPSSPLRTRGCLASCAKRLRTKLLALTSCAPLQVLPQAPNEPYTLSRRRRHVVSVHPTSTYGCSTGTYFASSARLGRWLHTCKRCFPKALSMQTSVPAKRFWNAVRFTFTLALKRCEGRIEPRASSRV